MQVDESDPQKFDVIVAEQYMLADVVTCNFNIYPAHIYDSTGYLRDFSVRDLSDDVIADSLAHADPRLAPAHFNIAVLFLKQGNRKLALQEYAILKSLDAEAAERLFAKIYSERFEEIREPSAQPR